MSVTSAYVGVPVIDRYAAGLRGGRVRVGGRRRAGDGRAAVEHALRARPARDVDEARE